MTCQTPCTACTSALRHMLAEWRLANLQTVRFGFRCICAVLCPSSSLGPSICMHVWAGQSCQNSAVYISTCGAYTAQLVWEFVADIAPIVLTPGLKNRMCAGPKQIQGRNVLAYVCEHVTRSKTPVVDALLVLYPAFAAALTLHQVQTFCAQELAELGDKELPMRVHFLYHRWRRCGHRMLKRQAEDGELDRAGVPACAW